MSKLDSLSKGEDQNRGGAFKCAAPYAWNTLKKIFKLVDLVSLDPFKEVLDALLMGSSMCRYFT